MSIAAVVFDLDDTLFPEYDYVKSGFGAVADEIEKRFGVSGVKAKMLKLFDEDRNDVYGRTLDAYGIDYDVTTIAELVEIYRNHKPDLKMSDETRETLTALRGAGIKLGIITDGRPSGQRAKISALGVEELVDEIIITDELGGEAFRKPNPTAFETMCDRLGVPPQHVAYVGDNPKKDFAIKKYLPITTVRLSGGMYSDEPYKDGIEPDNSINKLSEILYVIGDRNGRRTV